MVTCLCDTLFRDVGVSAVRVLEKCGVRVDYPSEQTCCGQAALNSGYQEDARRSARAMLRAFAGSEYVVSPSGSCAAMVRCHYPDLFAGRPEQAEAESLAQRTYEISQFLVDVLGVECLPVSYRARATFHPSCHARRYLGADVAARRLLAAVDGLSLLPLPRDRDCCGFGGIFAVKMPVISSAMVEEKVEHVLASGAELLVGLDMSCLMNIEGHLRRRGSSLPVKHVVQILDEGWQA